MGTGVWVGALVPFAILLSGASADGGADARSYAVRAARRFSRVALIAMLLLMASGVMSALARGRRMVLVVLYTLPGSRARMRELARTYDVLSIIGVEVIAVPVHAPPDAIGELGSSPPALFPVVTHGTADIVATYRMFASGSHAELLIDRQGYIRAIWREEPGRMPEATAIQSQVEKLNEEKSPPPFPDDHVH